MSNYEVKLGDNLYSIVKSQYGLKNRQDILAKIKDVASANNLKNENLLFAGQKLNLPEQLRLNEVSIMTPDNNTKTVLRNNVGDNNYFEHGSETRTITMFGDIASKPEQYKNNKSAKSRLENATKATKNVVENVVADVDAFFTTDTARDLQAYDIAAKAARVGGFKDMYDSGKLSDAYKLFLEMNADDFTSRETEYKGKTERKEYLDSQKSDGKINLFALEERNGKTYLAMRDKDGVVHYFDPKNNCSEVNF